MPIITLEFDSLNVSIQPTDVVYWCKPDMEQAGKHHHAAWNTRPKKIGIVTNVNFDTNTIIVNAIPSFSQSNDNYYFFAKDRRVNHSGIIGYFTEAEYRNYSTLPAEIFATAVDWVESSK